MTAATGPKGQGINLDRCSAAAEHVLGDVAYGLAGTKYRYVQFQDAVTYVHGDNVCRGAAEADWKVTNDVSNAAPGLIPIGMIFQATANVPTTDQYGWVQFRGIADFIAGSNAIIDGDLLKVDSASDGLSDEAVAGTDEGLVGQALATVADNATGKCQLLIRG
jgi:hypothetical protein